MFKKIISTSLSAAFAASLIGSASAADISAAPAMRDMTTMEIASDMGIGINLGNTFESSGDWIEQWGDGTPNAYETAWGSPTVTEDLIKGYAAEGFDSLRIPVAWSNMMSKDGSYTISDKYMARVKQVTDWALDADLYVIVNLHWDGGWLEKLPTDHDNIMKKYNAIWTQVSDEFKDYGDKLIFESQNEELGWNDVWNQWSGSTNGKAESFGYVNEVNQSFVDIVRNSGGNNAQRHLLISGYNTSIDLTCDPLFKMPADPANRCAVSVHYYTPSTFTILTEDADWGKSAYTWGSDASLQS
ncbi:glycoside hydrolase family 5 protein [Ruminococcus flavefaciens]|uniref:glycoside hydrolase family 5 protein n=1 Tax=Ruminococcus flavefaciens TaxID=1265 RepID=UPI0025D9FE0C|nr:glycoside hydrolase family 5 protein [Ruminococcus flavefaciens]